MTKTDQVTLRDIYESIQDFRTEVRETYVTKNEFLPVKSITYGLVTLIMVAVIGALVATVVRAF
jgi:hypothetical protein